MEVKRTRRIHSLENIMTTTSGIPVTLKWSKQSFQLEIDKSESAIKFKEKVATSTGVPVERQKLLGKGWKGPLQDDFNLAEITKAKLIVTLLGSAETLAEPGKKRTFLEDLSPEQLAADEQARLAEAMADAEGMIAALQQPPHLRDDGKQEAYQYNRVVTGLPQRQIEDLLRKQRKESTLIGEVAMTLGLALRRAYVNDLAVLKDGTCVTASDDGHVQLWKHAALEYDVVHGGNDGGVDSVVALRHPNIAFGTGGRGCVRLWTSEAVEVLALPMQILGTSPDSLISLDLGQEVTCLAARFKITQQVNPHQFRLPPQDEQGRQRRAQAEAQEAAIWENLDRVSRSVQVWFSVGGTTELRSIVLEPRDSSGSAPVTSLQVLPGSSGDSCRLLVGDTSGGIRIWHARRVGGAIRFEQQQIVQLVPPSSQACSIVCMELLKDGLVLVSTNTLSGASSTAHLSGATEVDIPVARAVHVMQFQDAPSVQTTLDGHKDVVTCIKALPNGDILTGGGKMDATLQLWTNSQLKPQTEVQTESSKTLSDVGYIFGLAVLPDTKPGSEHFAVAAARYNVIKIVL
jgi:WD40 repeat protein